MLNYKKGNILEDSAEALVNTVNEVGVMGKGVALMFKEAFPDSARIYEKACKAGEVSVGTMLVTRDRDLTGERWIINFPTKKHWRHPSKLEWIRDGLNDLVRVIEEHHIQSIAIPPLGCGNGGLEWSQVRKLIEATFSDLPDVDVAVYAPISEYQNAPKRAGMEELTQARAVMVEMVRRYSVLGLDCTNLEVQKLAWFLTRSYRRLKLKDPLALNFNANKFGPYADNLRHLLNGLDGSYLHCEKRLADANPLDNIWFESGKLVEVTDFLKSDQDALSAIDETAAIIDGFESPLGMELLATVDWLIDKEGCQPTVGAIRGGLANWFGGGSPARRKLKLFDERLVSLALERLVQFPSVTQDA
jgi:O-acetyl-ADP-ribose deacetylase (regulator of RNase III)